MNVLVVHAHPETRSSSSALAHTAVEALSAAGHAVTLSDLYANGFNPVSVRHNFCTVHNPDYYKQQQEEMHASEHDGFAPDLESEIEKLEQADLLKQPDPYKGLFGSKTVLVVAARGDSGYGPEGANWSKNDLEPYVVDVFRFLGVANIKAVAVENDEHGGLSLRQSMSAAEATLRDLAAEIAAGPRLSRCVHGADQWGRDDRD